MKVLRDEREDQRKDQKQIYNHQMQDRNQTFMQERDQTL